MGWACHFVRKWASCWTGPMLLWPEPGLWKFDLCRPLFQAQRSIDPSVCTVSKTKLLPRLSRVSEPLWKLIEKDLDIHWEYEQVHLMRSWLSCWLKQQYWSTTIWKNQYPYSVMLQVMHSSHKVADTAFKRAQDIKPHYYQREYLKEAFEHCDVFIAKNT
jgi:hypothetical protein